MTGSIILVGVNLILCFEKRLDICIYTRLRKKIRALLQDINTEIASEGIYLEFRQTKKLCCFCISCCACCNTPDYDTIDIWARDGFANNPHDSGVHERLLGQDG